MAESVGDPAWSGLYSGRSLAILFKVTINVKASGICKFLCRISVAAVFLGFWSTVCGGAARGDFESGSIDSWTLTGAGAVVSSNAFAPPIAPAGGQFMGYITTLDNEGAEDFGFFNESPDIDANGVREIEYSALGIAFTVAVQSRVSVDLNFLTDELQRGSVPDVNDSDVFGLVTGDVRTGPYRLLYAIAPSNAPYTGNAERLTPSAFSNEQIVQDGFGMFPTIPGNSRFQGQTGFRNHSFSVGPGTHSWTFFVADSHTDGVASAMLIDNFIVTPIGSEETIVRVADINPGTGGSYPSYMTVFNGRLYFRGNLGLNNTELWQFDGTNAFLAAEIYPGPNGSSPSYLVSFDGSLFFDAQNPTSQLWRFDGANASVVSSSPTFSSIDAWKPVVFFNELCFRSSRGLSRFNGNTMSELARPPYAASEPVVFNGSLYYGAGDSANGVELWRFNGAAQARVTDINPGSADGSPENLIVFGNALYFRARDAGTGYELWRHNGTIATRVADINPGVASSHPAGFVIFQGAIYFQADDGIHGYELWRCDGTNVIQVADINRNSIYESGGDRMSDSNPRNLTVLGGYLYFSAHDGHGNGLWRYDGTNAVLIGGGTVDSINELVVFQDNIYFDNDDGYSGRELWKVKVNPEPRMEISAPSSEVKLQLHDAITGTYVIEGSDDLRNWFFVATNPAVNGTLRFTDTTAVNSQHRSYRAVVAP